MLVYIRMYLEQDVIYKFNYELGNKVVCVPKRNVTIYLSIILVILERIV